MKRCLFVLWCFGGLTLAFNGCGERAKHLDPSSHESSTQSTTVPSVEQELLRTLKHAEDLGQGNPLLLSSLYSLANFYSDHKEYDKAAHQYQRALSIKEQANGPNHPDVAEILQRYAQVLQKANRPAEAAHLLTRAQAILEKSPADNLSP